MEELLKLLSLFENHNLLIRPYHASLKNFDPDLVGAKYYINGSYDYQYFHEVKELSQAFESKYLSSLLSESGPHIINAYAMKKVHDSYEAFQSVQKQFLNDQIPVSYRVINSSEFLLDENYEPGVKKVFSELEEINQKWVLGYFTKVHAALDTIRMILDFSKENVEPVNSKTDDQSRFPAAKVRFKLSVGEIALLFRLLVEAKYIELDTKSELFRAISTTFASLKADEISLNSLNKKFHDPDTASRNELDIILTNLRLELKKIQ